MVSNCEHQMHGACPMCLSQGRSDTRALPTAAPPPLPEFAADLRARALRIDLMAQKLAREAADLFFAADRIERGGG